MVPPETPAPPKFATPRTPGLLTYGPAIAAVAASMNTPLMPWQHLGADMVGEVHPDGRFSNPFVVITVPRQAGKTTLVLAKSVHRCLYLAARRVWYTAETGKKARDKWAEMLDVLEADGSPLRALIKKTKRSNGDELLQFVNGSTLNPFPPTRDGLHSKQSDLVDIDEGWAHSEADGAAILAGVTPTQATRPFRQVVVLSTMGDAASLWLHNLIDFAKGEGDAVAGLDLPRPAILEYGVPDGTDADDLETIAHYHPAFGYTIDLQALVDARAQLIAANGVELGKAEFLRAYGNLRSSSRALAFPAERWNRAGVLGGQLAGLGRPALGVAVGDDGADAAIWAGWVVGGVLLVERVDYRPGTSWVVGRLLGLREKWGRLPVFGDRGGPAGPVLDAYELAERKRLRDDRADVLGKFTRGDYAAACADMRDRVIAKDEPEPRWLWRPEPATADGRPQAALTAAQLVANRKHTGDGTWVWGRRASAGSIAALEAATCAGWAALHAPRVAEKPLAAWA